MIHLLEMSEFNTRKTTQEFLDIINKECNIKEVCTKLVKNLKRYEIEYAGWDCHVNVKVFSSDNTEDNIDLVLYYDSDLNDSDLDKIPVELNGDNTKSVYGKPMSSTEPVAAGYERPGLNDIAKNAIVKLNLKMELNEPEDVIADMFSDLEKKYGFNKPEVMAYRGGYKVISYIKEIK